MPTFQITLSHENYEAIRDAVAARAGWTPTVLNEEGQEIPNPIPAGQVLTDRVMAFLADELVNYQRTQLQSQLDAINTTPPSYTVEQV